MDGDEMTRIMWQMVKDKLLFPYLDMDIDYYDLHVKHRDDTDDRVTADARAPSRNTASASSAQRSRPTKTGEGIHAQESLEKPQRHDPRHA